MTDKITARVDQFRARFGALQSQQARRDAAYWLNAAIESLNEWVDHPSAPWCKGAPERLYPGWTTDEMFALAEGLYALSLELQLYVLAPSRSTEPSPWDE